MKNFDLSKTFADYPVKVWGGFMKFFLILLIICCCFLHGNIADAYDKKALKYNTKGIEYTKKAEYDKAVKCFRKAIKEDTSLTNAYYNLGSVYRHKGEPEKALNAFKLLMRNTPEDDEAAYLVAELYFEKQDYDKSLVYLNSIEKESDYHQKSCELFSKINEKISKSVIKEESDEKSFKLAPLNYSKLTLTNFKGPAGIAETDKGFLYIADFLSDSIQVFSSDGQLKDTITDKLIKGPVGIAVDSKNNIYVANYLAGNIIKITENNSVEVFLKDIAKPYYLYFNKAGVLFVSEQDKNTVIKLGIPE